MHGPPSPGQADSADGLQRSHQGQAHQLQASNHFRVRRDRIDAKGKVTLRYLGKLRHIPVGAAHRHRKVLLLVAGADVRIVTTDGTLLRQLTFDPNRSYQPLGGRWPVHLRYKPRNQGTSADRRGSARPCRSGIRGLAASEGYR